MSEEWQYQVRIDLPAATAELARRDLGAPELRPLAAILARHQATLTCQFDAFAGYVAKAERKGVGHYPLYEWTKKTIKDPAKKAKYLQVFTFYIEGHEAPEGASRGAGRRPAAADQCGTDHACCTIRHQPSEKPATTGPFRDVNPSAPCPVLEFGRVLNADSRSPGGCAGQASGRGRVVRD